MFGVRVVWNEAAILALGVHPEVIAEVMAAAEPVVERARAGAPRRSGAGAASIRAEPVFADGHWGADISWDRDHYYMRFHELGDKYLPARPFLVPALDRYR